jgi:hypothetical protein
MDIINEFNLSTRLIGVTTDSGAEMPKCDEASARIAERTEHW